MRLFIGIRVPPEIRTHLTDMWTTLSERPRGVRDESPQNLHLTVAFLGEVEQSKIQILSALIARATERPPRGSFSVEGFETFPRKNPTLVIANINREDGMPWKSYIEKLRDMVSVVAPQVDRKPWIPHITIARSNKSTALPVWSHSFKHIAWQPTELSLIMSEATKNGSKYTDLNIFPLS